MPAYKNSSIRITGYSNILSDLAVISPLFCRCVFTNKFLAIHIHSPNYTQWFNSLQWKKLLQTRTLVVLMPGTKLRCNYQCLQYKRVCCNESWEFTAGFYCAKNILKNTRILVSEKRTHSHTSPLITTKISVQDEKPRGAWSKWQQIQISSHLHEDHGGRKIEGVMALTTVHITLKNSTTNR